MNAKCDNCGKITIESMLNEARDLHQRVDMGGEMPAGECPACGSLAYLVDEKPKKAPANGYGPAQKGPCRK